MTVLTRYLRLWLRPCLQLVLLGVFLHFFGLPAVSRYQRMEVMVVSSRRDTGGIQAPAITIAALTGWKDGFHDIESKGSSNFNSYIEQKTYNQSETLNDVILGWKNESLLNQEGVVTEDFTVPPAGRYYTINILKKIGPNYMVDQLFVVLFNINYRIWIHDPNFFIITENPTFVPALLKVLEPNRTSSHYYCLTLTEVEELDVPEDPCNTDPDYSFQACVRKSLSSELGCRTKWDRWSHQDIPLCTEMEQFRVYNNFFQKLWSNEIYESDITGCRKPCFYKKYRFVGDKRVSASVSDDFSFSLWSVSVDTKTEKEQLVYPTTSLVAEFGGALGLFLGFSFMVVWDTVGNFPYRNYFTKVI